MSASATDSTTPEAPPIDPLQSEEDKRLREETKQIVIESIGDMLEDAWSKPEAERKKLIKQLLLKWHPDKNTDTEEDEELATAATQHIHGEVERLEQGLPRNGSASNFTYGSPGASGFDPRNPFANSPTYRRYFEEAYRAHSEQMNRRRKEEAERKERDRQWRSKYSKPTFSYSGTSGGYSSTGSAYSGSSGSKFTSGTSGSKYSTPGGSTYNGSSFNNKYTSGSATNGSSSSSSSTNGTKYSNGTSYTRPETSYTRPETSYTSTPPPPSSSYSASNDDNSVFAKVALLLRQARADLRSADNDYDVTEPAYEWVLFKSHQAAEKALKSFNLLKNNTKSFSHELASLSAIARDEELRRMATKLQELIGDSNKLYNLVFMDTEVTPHDEITKETACDTMMCAREILERVQELTGITT